MVKMIRQLTVIEPRRVELVATQPVELAPGMARIRVENCGICGSDVTMYKGAHPVIKPPIVLGHEVIGTLSDFGDGKPADFKLGERVAFLPQTGCGKCRACLRGEERLCPQMKLIGGQIPGGMAESVDVPVANLIRVPENVPPPLRVLAEPLAVGVHAAGRVSLKAGDECVVLGAGPIGLLVGFALKARGVSRITVIDLDPARLEIARHFGFIASENMPEQPGSFDVAFECVGGAAPARTVLEAVHSGGFVVLVGVAAPELSFSGILLQRQERTVTGSHMYSREEFEEAFRLLGNGTIPHDEESLSVLFDRRGLEQAPAMLAELNERRAKAIKLVVDL